MWMSVSGLCGPLLLIWLLRQRVVNGFTLNTNRRIFLTIFVNIEDDGQMMRRNVNDDSDIRCLELRD